MIRYEKKVLKSVQKGKIPKDVFVHFNNALIALDATNDFTLSDIKKLKESSARIYYRLRKGKYRAIFYTENKDIFVIALAKREEVYNKWE